MYFDVFCFLVIIKHLANHLDIFIYKNAIKHNLPIEYVTEWKGFILKYFKTQLISLKQNNTVINQKNVH